MAYYDLSKAERAAVYQEMYQNILSDVEHKNSTHFLTYASNQDTYIRKNAYLAIGRIAKKEKRLKTFAIDLLKGLITHHDEHVRQTVINAFGEIGCYDFESVADFFEAGLFDPHHKVRNAVIGSIKKMGEKNPVPVLAFCEKYLLHDDFEIRREICHGIELRGRTHPQDILPMLQALEFDQKPRVRNTLVHVIGQIAYKKGCLETVCEHLKNWENKILVEAALAEIIDVHRRYANFSFYTQSEAKQYIEQHFNQQLSDEYFRTI